jgi:hypothetical protein
MSADFWAGYISGAAGIIIGNPLDLLKTRLQAGDTSVHATSAESLRGTFDRAGTLVRGELGFLLLCHLTPFYRFMLQHFVKSAPSYSLKLTSKNSVQHQGFWVLRTTS